MKSLKKIFAVLAVLIGFSASSHLFAQLADAQAVQLLSPKEVFIGDTAEISYTFYSPIAFPMGETDSVYISFPKEFS